MFSQRVLLILSMVLVSGCWDSKVEWVGYIDSDRLDIIAPSKGYLTEVHLSKGDFVESGQLVAKLTYEQDLLEIESAKHAIRAKVWAVNNLLLERFSKDSGSEHALIIAYQEKLRAAMVENKRATLHWERMDALLEKSAVSVEAWESAKAQWEQSGIALREAESALEGVIGGASPSTQNEKFYQIKSDIKKLQLLEKKVQDQTIYSPARAFVYKVYANEGALLSEGSNIMSLGIVPYYVVFYASAKEIATLKLGHHVKVVQTNGSHAKAKLSNISYHAVFTPPIVYADGGEDEYRYRVEATLEDITLHPGQPVRVIWSQR